ncbi:hypothetical protein J3R30DRAFT_3714381 [Lentinula aciculospora]|uniref:Uncharacterized protein n=1 Tax=Lentinula aciculospora TaxID=153920 RepID=A0A9W8ZXG0_9AGAR|nr:hypothetical protein J3R30DRAFT_3714381 [Lentinula aciculospora]
MYSHTLLLPFIIFAVALSANAAPCGGVDNQYSSSNKVKVEARAISFSKGIGHRLSSRSTVQYRSDHSDVEDHDPEWNTMINSFPMPPSSTTPSPFSKQEIVIGGKTVLPHSSNHAFAGQSGTPKNAIPPNEQLSATLDELPPPIPWRSPLRNIRANLAPPVPCRSPLRKVPLSDSAPKNNMRIGKHDSGRYCRG